MKQPSHFDASGQVHMVDVGNKPVTERQSQARGVVKMQPATLELIRQDKITKGNVLALAQTAGIMGAKQTPHLIPLCHPLLLSQVKVDFRFDDKNNAIEITATVRCTGQTGVEMEALTAVAISALTIYDMCKAVDPSMRIQNIRLVSKSGGKSGTVVLE